MWGWVLKAAVAVGLDRWAKRKAVEVAGKLRSRARNKADAILEAVGTKVAPPGSIVIREDRDILRPGMVVVRDSVSFRITKLLLVNRAGAFYEAKPE